MDYQTVIKEMETNLSTTLPTFPLTFNFERDFDTYSADEWFLANYHRCLYYSISYVVLVYLGQMLMKNRAPWNLKWLLVFWNTLLALMSIGGSFRLTHELLHVLHHHGFKASICSFTFLHGSPVSGFWTCVFVLSKVAELLDTLFVILRKQNLLFLHWFHHSSVLIYTWVIAHDRTAMSRWFMAMNYTIHAFMYSYYALRSLKVRVPRRVALFLTSAQILQMMVGLYLNVHASFLLLLGKECSLTGRAALFGTSLYSFYFILFCQFFFTTYIQPRLKANVKRD